MKLMFIETLGDGGIAHYTYNLVSALKRRGHKVLLATTRIYELVDMMEEEDLRCIFFKGAFRLMRSVPTLSKETLFPTLFRRFLKVIEYPINTIECILIGKEKGVDLIHFQVLHLIDIFMVFWYRLAGFRVVFTVHNVMPVHKPLNWAQRGLYGLLYRYCDLFIIHSEVSKAEFKELFWVPSEKIQVVPHGDYQFFVPEKPLSKDEAKGALGIDSKRKTILFFGAIRDNKGLEEILKALPRIRKGVPEVMLLIVGEAIQGYEKYRDLIRILEIEGSVMEVLRYVSNEEIATFFYATDVVVLPYREVSQSGVLQIAYAFGLPVVATAVGGFLEAIEDGKNGFLVPPQALDLLADRVAKVLSDDERAEAMGRHSLFLAKTMYSWKEITERTEALYQLLEERKG